MAPTHRNMHWEQILMHSRECKFKVARGLPPDKHAMYVTRDSRVSLSVSLSLTSRISYFPCKSDAGLRVHVKQRPRRKHSNSSAHATRLPRSLLRSPFIRVHLSPARTGVPFSIFLLGKDHENVLGNKIPESRPPEKRSREVAASTPDIIWSRHYAFQHRRVFRSCGTAASWIEFCGQNEDSEVISKDSVCKIDRFTEWQRKQKLIRVEIKQRETRL